jgi:hypothetical protein
MFIERQHSLSVMIDGYRDAIFDAFGIELPVLGNVALDEPEPVASLPPPVTTAYTVIDSRVADALARLRLASHDATIQAAAAATVRLRLDRLTADRNGRETDEPVTTDS